LLELALPATPRMTVCVTSISAAEKPTMHPSQGQERTIDVHDDHGPEARQSIHKLAELIHDIHTAMLTTVTAEGHLRTRPMATRQSDLSDELWFYTDARSSLIDDITENHQVCLAYVDPSKQRYVTVSGVGHVIRDRDLLERLWHPGVAQWFPNGPDRDPYLALLRVQLEEAEYWDVASGSMVKLSGFARSDERQVPRRPMSSPDGLAPHAPDGKEVLGHRP
jgi:general stress protein 26